jgi:hypothetical protein
VAVILNIEVQRGTRDTPNSMGAERQRAQAKHKQTQATQDTPTRDRLQTHPPAVEGPSRGELGASEQPSNRSRQVILHIESQRETEEKARQPETKLGAITQKSHKARQQIEYIFTERDGRKGPPAGNKAKCKIEYRGEGAAGRAPVRGLAQPSAAVV